MREEMENEKLDSFQDFLFFCLGGGGWLQTKYYSAQQLARIVKIEASFWFLPSDSYALRSSFTIS